MQYSSFEYDVWKAYCRQQEQRLVVSDTERAEKCRRLNEARIASGRPPLAYNPVNGDWL